jgi:hypothetical protein
MDLIARTRVKYTIYYLRDFCSKKILKAEGIEIQVNKYPLNLKNVYT